MDKNSNVAFLVANYHLKLRTKDHVSLVTQSDPLVDSSSSEVFQETKDDSQRAFDNLLPGDLETLAEMSYLQRIAPKPTLDVILDPVSRLKVIEIDICDFASDKKQKVRPLNDFTSHDVYDDKENRGLLGSCDVKEKALDRKDLRLSKPNILSASNRKNNEKAKDRSQTPVFGSKKIQAKTSNVRFKLKEEPDVLDKLENTEEQIMNEKINSYQDLFEFAARSSAFVLLPEIMLEFPDEVDPLEFFTQHAFPLGNFINYFRTSYPHNPNLRKSNFRTNRGSTITSLIILLTDQLGIEHKIRVPFSLAYFILSLPHIVQLCLINNYASAYLAASKKLGDTVDVEIFIKTIERLYAIESLNNSVVSFNSNIRKSLFGNAKLNNVFGDMESGSGSRSQVITNFDDKIGSYTRGLSKSCQKSNNTTNKEKKLTVENLEPVKHGFMDSSSLFKTLAVNQHINPGHLSEIGDSSFSEENSKLSSNNKSCSPEDQSSKAIRNIPNEKFDESSSSDEDDSSDGCRSLEEGEYSTKNPYEMRYMTLTLKFRSYTIEVLKPQVQNKEGQNVRYLVPKDLSLVFTDDLDRWHEPFGELALKDIFV